MLPNIKVCIIGHTDIKRESIKALLGFWCEDKSVSNSKISFATMNEFEIPYDIKNSTIGSNSTECVNLVFVDTNNRTKQTRQISFPYTDVFLVISPDAHKKEWIDEIQSNNAAVPYVFAETLNEDNINAVLLELATKGYLFSRKKEAQTRQTTTSMCLLL